MINATKGPSRFGNANVLSVWHCVDSYMNLNAADMNKGGVRYMEKQHESCIVWPVFQQGIHF